MNELRAFARVKGWTAVMMGLYALGCSGSQGKGSQAADERAAAQTPEEIEALFSREKELPAAREAKAPNGAWTAQFPSDSEVIVTAEGDSHAQAEFSLGTEAKTRCVFYAEAIDAGQTVAIVLDGLRKKAKLESISAYRVTSVQGIPVVFLEGRYTIAIPGGKQGGSLKLALTPRLQTPVLCFLDEPGYVEAFTSAVTGVLSTLTTKEPASELAYSEVWAISIDTHTFGYQWLQVLDEGQGKRTTVTLSAGFVPAGPGELMTTDEVKVLKSDASGVLEGSFSQVESGEVEHDLTLTRSGKSKYQVTGKVQGKDFKSEFTATKLPDDIASYRLVAQNHKKTTKLTTKEYNPSLDPSALSNVDYAIDGKAHTVAITLGELAMLGTLTEEGLVSQVTSRLGEREIKQEIIHRAGKL
jgi:hypothetical protein